jgi:hypothetical protein
MSTEPGEARPGPAEGNERATVGGLLAAVFRVVAPTAVMTALLFYFGWARTEAAAQRAGIDQSLFGFSTNDYLLRSVSPLFRPFGVGLLFAVIAVIAGGLAKRHISSLVAEDRISGQRLALGIGTLIVTGVLAIAVGAPQLSQVGTQKPAHLSAVLIILGAVLLRAALALDAIGNGQLGDVLGPQRDWLLGILVATVLVGMFAVILRLAFEDGAESINRFAGRLGTQSEVIVTSSTPLDIALSGVVSEVVESPAEHDVGPRFRYRGLHLLLETNDRLFLVTKGFGVAGETSAVVVIPHTDDLRLDFVISEGAGRVGLGERRSRTVQTAESARRALSSTFASDLRVR